MILLTMEEKKWPLFDELKYNTRNNQMTKQVENRIWLYSANTVVPYPVRRALLTRLWWRQQRRRRRRRCIHTPSVVAGNATHASNSNSNFAASVTNKLRTRTDQKIRVRAGVGITFLLLTYRKKAAAAMAYRISTQLIIPVIVGKTYVHTY